VKPDPESTEKEKRIGEKYKVLELNK